MLKTYFTLIFLLLTNLQAWEGQNLTFGEDINCNYYKTNAPDIENTPYQKCMTYKTIFEEFSPFVTHYNEQNRRDEKYTMKYHDTYAEYQFKKYIYENMKNNKSIDKSGLEYSKREWEYKAIKEVYDNINIHKPILMNKYGNEVAKWFINGDGQKISNAALIQMHKLRQVNVKEGLLMKYQYRINTSYTSLLEIEKELTKRNLHFNFINFQLGN